MTVRMEKTQPVVHNKRTERVPQTGSKLKSSVLKKEAYYCKL